MIFSKIRNLLKIFLRSFENVAPELHTMSDPAYPYLFFTVEVHDTLGRPLFLLKCGRVQSIVVSPSVSALCY